MFCFCRKDADSSDMADVTESSSSEASPASIVPSGDYTLACIYGTLGTRI